MMEVSAEDRKRELHLINGVLSCQCKDPSWTDETFCGKCGGYIDPKGWFTDDGPPDGNRFWDAQDSTFYTDHIPEYKKEELADSKVLLSESFLFLWSAKQVWCYHRENLQEKMWEVNSRQLEFDIASAVICRPFLYLFGSGGNVARLNFRSGSRPPEIERKGMNLRSDIAILPIETLKSCHFIWSVGDTVNCSSFDRTHMYLGQVEAKMPSKVLTMSARIEQSSPSNDKYRRIIAVTVTAQDDMKVCGVLELDYEKNTFKIIREFPLTYDSSNLSRPVIFGDYVAFEKIGGAQELLLLDMRNGNTTLFPICDRVMDGQSNPSPPIIANDIAYLKKRDADNEIAVVRLTDSDHTPQQLIPSDETVPDHKRWISRGGYVYFMNHSMQLQKVSGNHVDPYYNKEKDDLPEKDWIVKSVCNGKDLIYLYNLSNSEEIKVLRSITQMKIR